VTSGRLRIAFVYDALYPEVKGGGERRFHEIGKRLSDRHEVHHVSWRWWPGSRNITRDGVQLHSVGAPPALYGNDGKRNVGEAVAFAARLLPVLLRRRFDVIDCSATPYIPVYSCWLASRMTRTPLVVTWHEFWGDYWLSYLSHRPRIARMARWVEAQSRRFGEILVPVSPFTARRLGVDPESRRIRIVGNGVALDEIAAVEASQEPFDVVFLGRLIEDKRVDLLIEAIALLRERFPRILCLVIGDGPERASLEAHASTLGLGDRVRFAGQLDSGSTFGHMKGAKIVVLPSVREGFGMTVVEAQACGSVPVVARSAMSAAPDLVRDGVDGLLCDPTRESMAEAIAALLADPERLETMRSAALESAQGRGWDTTAAQMEAVYTEVVTARGDGRPPAS
jgi:glycosyltransferase involved in cell wall biosynthesis